MLSVEEASKTVAARIQRLAVETVSLDDARGRILGTDAVAARPLPSFDNSAMDGFAARSTELPGTLPMVAQVGAGQIVDSSAHSLAALIAGCGGIPHYVGIAKDDPATLTALIASALDHDVVITTGGVSVGDRDHVRAALETAGVELELWKVAM